MKLRLTHHYPDSTPREVWNLATSLAALHEVCAPLLNFEGIPREGRIKTGDHFEPLVRLFGRMPPQPYAMTVVSCDDDAMSFQSDEKGAGVRKWAHHLQVLPEGDGARIEEEIEIKAGLLTPLFYLWARTLYRHRHKPRLKLLAQARA